MVAEKSEESGTFRRALAQPFIDPNRQMGGLLLAAGCRDDDDIGAGGSRGGGDAGFRDTEAAHFPDIDLQRGVVGNLTAKNLTGPQRAGGGDDIFIEDHNAEGPPGGFGGGGEF